MYKRQGSGCGLDSARLRTEISKKVGVSPKSIDAYMIGEHGFSPVSYTHLIRYQPS